ncbi:hypothetical protein Tco_1239806, partial [Tanacetum coccineum]
FWGTTTARITNDGEVEIIASIDGHVKTIIEASVRRHLKLEDSDDKKLRFLVSVFYQTQVADEVTFISVDVDAGGAATTDIDLDADRVEDLENDLQQTKKVYSYALTKLILRVKKLEKKVKTNKARRRARIVILEDEDAEEDSSKQGRKISEIDKDPIISLVQPEQDMEYDFDVSTAEGFTTASVPVTTASAFISTASATPEVSTAAANLVYIRRSAEKRKDKGKAIMKDDESVQKKSKKQLEQERLGHEEAIRLQEQINEEENQRIARDAEIAKQLQEEFDRARQEQEVVAEADQAHDIDWSDPAVLRYHALQNRSFSVAEARCPGSTQTGTRKNQQDYNLISWRLFDTYGIHMLLMHTGISIHMMIEKKYPLIQEMLSRMLSRRLEVDQESEMAFELLRYGYQEKNKNKDKTGQSRAREWNEREKMSLTVLLDLIGPARVDLPKPKEESKTKDPSIREGAKFGQESFFHNLGHGIDTL